MMTNQQKEALIFFNKYSAEWRKKALITDQQEVNIIQQRNSYVLHVINNRTKTNTTLDVGCGTGDLVCEIARKGIDSTGVDFAEKMIEIACTRVQKEQLEKAHFYCCSIYDLDLSNRKYDVISANGFIEYISFGEFERFLNLAYRTLNPGGSLVLGSRNRLFNIFSLNEFTLDELNSGTITLLLKEAIEFAKGTSIKELLRIETTQLQNPNNHHTNTGIDVSIRYQYTPVQLIKVLSAKGFIVNQVYPIHIHGVTPSFKNTEKEMHTFISNLLQNYANKYIYLVPYSSSFMLNAVKEL